MKSALEHCIDQRADRFFFQDDGAIYLQAYSGSTVELAGTDAYPNATKVFFDAAGPVLGEASSNPTEMNIARGLVAATEEFKRGCSQEGSHGEPWACPACSSAYLEAVRKLASH